MPKALIAEALADAGVIDASREVVGQKKSDAVITAQAALTGKRWLPELLRVEASEG